MKLSSLPPLPHLPISLRNEQDLLKVGSSADGALYDDRIDV